LAAAGFDAQVLPVPPGNLLAAVEAVAAGEVRSLAAVYAKLYDIDWELTAAGPFHDRLLLAARYEIALRTLLTEARAAVLVDVDLSDLGEYPALAIQRLTAEGIGFGRTWTEALLMRAVAVMGGDRPGGVSLMVPVGGHLSGDDVTIETRLPHLCPALTTTRPRLAATHPLGLSFMADPAPGAVLAALSDLGGHLRLTAAVVDIVTPSAGSINHDEAGAWVAWQPRPSVPVATDAWVTAAGTQDRVLTTAVGIAEFEVFAQFARSELLVIDEFTTRRGLADQAKFNAALFRPHVSR
jgi:L-arabinose isomerase